LGNKSFKKQISVCVGILRKTETYKCLKHNKSSKKKSK